MSDSESEVVCVCVRKILPLLYRTYILSLYNDVCLYRKYLLDSELSKVTFEFPESNTLELHNNYSRNK